MFFTQFAFATPYNFKFIEELSSSGTCLAFLFGFMPLMWLYDCHLTIFITFNRQSPIYLSHHTMKLCLFCLKANLSNQHIYSHVHWMLLTREEDKTASHKRQQGSVTKSTLYHRERQRGESTRILWPKGRTTLFVCVSVYEWKCCSITTCWPLTL